MELRVGWSFVLASLLLAFVLSMAIAWVYRLTYLGLSYSRSFVQTLALAGTVSCLIMLAIGNDIARGLGLVGALSVIRFRATLKDTRDLLFIFASLGIGVACGVQSFGAAVLGTAVYSVAVVYITWSDFGSRRQFDAILRLHLPSDRDHQEAFRRLLVKHCASHILMNLRDVGGNLQEHAYHIKLLDLDERGALIRDLGAVPGLSGVTLLMQDTTVEV